jgi:hypothetical protein
VTNADAPSLQHGRSRRVFVDLGLHCHDGVPAIAFKQCTEDICCEFSTMPSAEEAAEQATVADGIDINLPAVTGIPFGPVAPDSEEPVDQRSM